MVNIPRTVAEKAVMIRVAEIIFAPRKFKKVPTKKKTMKKIM